MGIGTTLNLMSMAGAMTSIFLCRGQMISADCERFQKRVMLAVGTAILVHLGAQVFIIWEGTLNPTWVLVSLCLFHAGVMFWLRKPLSITFGVFSLLAAVLVR